MDPFEHSPFFQLHLDDDAEIMAANFDNLLDAIAEHIRTQICNGPNGFVEEILIAPKGAGFYIVEILPPATWTHNNVGPVRLLFAFENLYCMGFYSNTNWFRCSDHYKILEKRGDIQIQGSNVRSLTFDGNYNRLGPSFASVNLGQFAFYEIYTQIPRFPGSTVEGPLRMCAVCFSECLRFPWFQQYILDRMAASANHPDDISAFANHFRNWSRYSLLVRVGRAAFTPKPEWGLDSFDDLLGFISVVL